MPNHMWVGARRRVVAAMPPTANMLWDFDAENITPQLDNTSLAAWPDGAPTPHNLQSPGTNGGTQPKYRTGASGVAINGHPVVQVASGNQMDMPYPNFSPLITGQPFTCYWVGRYTPTGGGGILLFSYSTPPLSDVHALSVALDYTSEVAVQFDLGGGAGPTPVFFAAATSGVQLLTIQFSSTGSALYRNGSLVVSGTTWYDWDWGNDFHEFFAVAGGVAAAIGEHTRFLAYKAMHDNTTRAAIETHLKTRYGIP